MKMLLVLALVLVSASAFAQTSTVPNKLGIYFDTVGVANSKGYGEGATVTAYLVATHISQMDGMSEWECRILLSPGVAMQDVVFSFNTPNACVNTLVAPDFMVAVGPAYATAPAMWLLRIRFTMPDSVPTVFLGFGPSLAATSFPLQHVAGYGSGSGVMTPFTPAAVAMPVPGVPGGYYVAGANHPFGDPTTNDSWSGVKNLYR